MIRLLAFLVAVTCVAPPALADTLIDNVRGRTLLDDGRVKSFTGLLIDETGRVAKLLDERDKRPKQVDYRYDGKGRVLLPGFVDAHARLIELGFAQQRLDLSSTGSLGEAQARIAHYAAANPGKPWILGQGWDAARWGVVGRVHAALDAAVADRPAWLIRGDGQVGWANSAALAAAGIDADTKAPRGGAIGMADGQPNGVLTGTAMRLIDVAAPKPRPLDRDIALQDAQTALLANGITTVTAMGIGIADWQALRRAGDAGELRMRVVAYADDIEDMILIGGSHPTPWLYDGRLQMAGVYLRLDGSPDAGTAWLSEREEPVSLLTPGQLRNKMTRAAMDGFQVAVKASGDLAVREFLDALAEVQPTYPGDRRWRLEMPMRVAAEDRARLTAMDVTAVSDADGPAMGAIKLAAGTGDSTTIPHPVSALMAASDPMSAWRAMTRGAARAAFAEDRLGSLAPGRRADFILLSGDPLTPGATGATVLESWVDGRAVFRR